MKNILVFLTFIASLRSFGLKNEFFAGINFDSSYTIVGIAQGHSEPGDSLERFWFALDNLQDLQQIQRDRVFKRPVTYIHIDEHPFDVFVIRDKQPAASILIYPNMGIATAGNGWYRFDSAILKRLHATHPIHYHSQERTFDTYPQYGNYGNTLLQDSTVLFFFHPSLRFQGSFTIESELTDPASVSAMVNDISKEIFALSPGGHYEMSLPKTYMASNTQHKKVRIDILSSKALYDDYNDKKWEKGPWEPTLISTTIFWRDR